MVTILNYSLLYYLFARVFTLLPNNIFVDIFQNVIFFRPKHIIVKYMHAYLLKKYMLKPLKYKNYFPAFLDAGKGLPDW